MDEFEDDGIDWPERPSSLTFADIEVGDYVRILLDRNPLGSGEIATCVVLNRSNVGWCVRDLDDHVERTATLHNVVEVYRKGRVEPHVVDMRRPDPDLPPF